MKRALTFESAVKLAAPLAKWLRGFYATLFRLQVPLIALGAVVLVGAAIKDYVDHQSLASAIRTAPLMAQVIPTLFVAMVVESAWLYQAMRSVNLPDGELTLIDQSLWEQTAMLFLFLAVLLTFAGEIVALSLSGMTVTDHPTQVDLHAVPAIAIGIQLLYMLLAFLTRLGNLQQDAGRT